MKIAALIIAAGNSTRFGGAAPKLFMPLGSTTVLGQTIQQYLSHPKIDVVQLVINPTHVEQLAQLPVDPKLLPFVAGGPQRAQSVLAGLEALVAAAPDYVLIADGARPFTSHALIDRVIAALGTHGVVPAISLVDTLKEIEGDKILATIDRQYLVGVQTPQAFPFNTIYELHRINEELSVTDDAGLFENAELPVRTILGDRHNFKITTQQDYELAVKMTATAPNFCIGQGYDIHRFKAGDHIMLGGVRLPHTHGVDAHSDGDVFLDALTDAILGAIGAGDIGQHFPPADPQWQNANSDQFVHHAINLLKARGGTIVNADLTLLAEAPKIGPYRAPIQAHIAGLLEVPASQVNIKAKTGEQMGPIGRGEGLAAQAIVLCQFT